MRSSPILKIVVLAAALITAGSARADQSNQFDQSNQPDLHALFEARCSSCHGHSGDFARQHLSIEQDRVVGSRGQPLEGFLKRHQGGLDAAEIDLLLALFREQITSGAVFRDRCATCHGTARDFARLKLILRDGVLLGRYSGREVGPFLVGHGRLDAGEAARMTEALRDILLGGR